jgi:hypothetical protein
MAFCMPVWNFPDREEVVKSQSFIITATARHGFHLLQEELSTNLFFLLLMNCIISYKRVKNIKLRVFPRLSYFFTHTGYFAFL